MSDPGMTTQTPQSHYFLVLSFQKAKKHVYVSVVSVGYEEKQCSNGPQLTVELSLTNPP